MVEVKICNLSLESTILRYYLLMALVLVGGFTGMWGISLLALPVFISALLGVSFKWAPFKKNQMKAKLFTIEPAEKPIKENRKVS